MRDDIIAYPRALMVATPQSPLADDSRDNSRHYLFFPDIPDVDNPCERKIIPQESPAEPRERFTIAIRERLKLIRQGFRINTGRVFIGIQRKTCRGEIELSGSVANRLSAFCVAWGG